MRKSLEPLAVAAGVDVFFAGHVHAYERTAGMAANNSSECGAVHITIGDGGNREKASMYWLDPSPEWSQDHESSFGFGTMEIIDADIARWTWRRNPKGSYDFPDQTPSQEPEKFDHIILNRTLCRSN